MSNVTAVKCSQCDAPAYAEQKREGYADFVNELNALFAPYTDIEAGN